MLRLVIVASLGLMGSLAFEGAFEVKPPPTRGVRLISPLVLDYDRDGRLGLTDAYDDKSVVLFDLDGDGIRERTGWVAPADALLAYDADGDGMITSGKELLGEYTNSPKARGPGQRTYRNGFLALAQFDHDHDGQLKKGEASFYILLAWRDANTDGVSQPEELTRLADTDIDVLPLGYRVANHNGAPTSVAGNEIRIEADYQTTTGSRYLVGDVWFRVRPTETLVSLSTVSVNQGH